jgi:hypothetical protein
MSDTGTQTVRDFIYLDVDWLYSLYSQVFEGVTREVTQAISTERTQESSQAGGFFSGGSEAAQVAKASLRTESKFLYDHMYNLLERHLGGNITGFETITTENYQDTLPATFMLKAQGKAEIHDYSRMDLLARKFNDLAGAVAYARAGANLGAVLPVHLISQASRATSPKRQQQLKHAIDEATAPRAVAEKLGMTISDHTLNNIRLLIEMFHPDGFEISIVPQGDGKLTFRGLLNKNGLRIPPDHLRALYGGIVESPWTMVGQVTYLPAEPSPGEVPNMNPPATVTNPEAGDSSEGVSEGGESGQTESAELQGFRDALRSMFEYSVDLERTFFESRKRIEVFVRPIAIYRETVLSRLG